MTPRKLTHAIALSLLLGGATLTFGQVTVSVNVAPPELPVYDQPPIPGDGYLWTPGYWAWSDDDQGYYWVPGTWVEAPQPGFLWTPGYWGFNDGVYLWNAGYWGPHVGFYGGVNYGFGYTGAGYQGGYWRDNHLYYNRSVVNVGGAHITNIYNRTVINNVTVNRVSYNGGSGGLRARPTAADEQAAHERHIEPTGAQRDHVSAASRDSSLRVSENHGRPSIAATAEPGRFTGNVMGAHNAASVPQNHGAPQNDRNTSDVRRNVERDDTQRAAPRQASPSHPSESPRPSPQVEQRPQPAHAPAPAPAPRQSAPEPRAQAQHQERAPEHEPEHH